MTSPWGAPQQQWGSRPGARPGWGSAPPPGWGRPQRHVPPRRRRNPLGQLFRGLCLLALLAVVGSVATNLAGSGSGSGSSSGGPYENADYRVPAPDLSPPPLPYAQSQREVDSYLGDNPFYTEQAPEPVECDLQTIDVANSSDAALESHLNDLTGCLMRVWEPPVTDAQYELPRPSVTVYGSRATTRCGTSGVNAFYCGADQQVYFSNRLASAVPAVEESPWGVDVVIAHEFGHALQARTGTLITAKLAVQDGSDAEQLVSSRRLETQADCLSGMFIRSVQRSLGIGSADIPAIEDTYRSIGDDALSGRSDVQGDHGLSRSRLAWGRAGLGSSDVDACNTFVAPASAVR